MHYTELNNMLFRYGKPIDRKKMANNTYAERRGVEGDIAIKLHNTDIMTWHPEGSVTLNSGGWRTVTTKERMNRWMPGQAGISQEKGVWYVYSGYNLTARVEERVLFYDGMVIGQFGELPTPPVKVDEEYHRDALMKLQIEKYIKGMTNEAVAKAVEKTRGDCLYCQLEWANHGKEIGGDHIELHVSDDEMYYMGTLMASAIRAAGYRPDVYLGSFVGGRDSFMLGVIKRSMRKYLQNRLLLANRKVDT